MGPRWEDRRVLAAGAAIKAAERAREKRATRRRMALEWQITRARRE